LKKKYIILVVILFTIFLIFCYKIFFAGNNIIKLNKEDIVEGILEGNVKYKADTKVTIYSNKNVNEYEIYQEENGLEESFLKVTSKGDIEGLEIKCEKNNIIIKNSNLKLEKIYENYSNIVNNNLFLNTFLDEYKEAEKVEKKENEENIIIKIKLKNSTKYIKYKELYFDAKTGLPKMLVIKNSSKQVVTRIEYINIEIL
jgi:hypothetical protein